jgi:predicted nucleic acid-binding protein
MRILVDTDVILDIFLQREPFFEVSNQIWQANYDGLCEAFISALTPANVFYVARKLKGIDAAHQAIRELLDGINIYPVDGAILQAASRSPISDYEDAVQHACAVANNLDAIVTRNLDDYRNATIPVYSPTDFLANLNKSE